MAKPQHRRADHIRAYKAIVKAQAAGIELWCVEPDCLFPSRVIYPWQAASVSHDQTGTQVIGDSHLKCNLTEAAVRGNRMRAQQKRLAL